MLKTKTKLISDRTFMALSEGVPLHQCNGDWLVLTAMPPLKPLDLLGWFHPDDWDARTLADHQAKTDLDMSVVVSTPQWHKLASMWDLPRYP